MGKKISKQHGFSFIELIVFIVVIGIVIAVIAVPLTFTNEKSVLDGYTNVAVNLARERMELILGQRHYQGFSTFTDPCTGGSPPADCTFTGYTISSTISNVTIGGDSSYKSVVVTVTGLGTATLTAIVGDY